MTDNEPRSLNLGNTQDDDAQVIDSLVQPTDTVAPEEQPRETFAKPPVPLEPLTRLVGAAWSMSSSWAPFLALPADRNRKRLTVTISSTTATDVVRVADDSGKAQTQMASALAFTGVPLVLDGHTGPVWLSCPDAAGTVVASVVAVTK